MDNGEAGFLIGMVTMFLILLVAIGVVEFKTRDDIHNEAVKLGHAEYYIDDDNERQFKWKPKK